MKKRHQEAALRGEDPSKRRKVGADGYIEDEFSYDYEDDEEDAYDAGAGGNNVMQDGTAKKNVTNGGGMNGGNIIGNINYD